MKEARHRNYNLIQTGSSEEIKMEQKQGVQQPVLSGHGLAGRYLAAFVFVSSHARYHYGVQDLQAVKTSRRLLDSEQVHLQSDPKPLGWIEQL
jgi:hypothetical protein